MVDINSAIINLNGQGFLDISIGNAADAISGGTFAFTDANAGAGNKTVTTTGVTLSDGNLGGNYTVSATDKRRLG